MKYAKQMNKLGIALILTAASTFSAFAADPGMADMKGMGNQSMQGMDGMKNMNDTKGADMAMTDGEVKKIDTAQGTVTLKHGPLDNLGMPGMTMVFKVADPAMLSTVKVGDRVKFQAENINGKIVVTKIQK